MSTATTTLQLFTESTFDFNMVMTSHGWVDLAPNRWISEKSLFERVEVLSNGKVLLLQIHQEIDGHSDRIIINVNHTAKLSQLDQAEIFKKVKHILRLEEDFSLLYKMAARFGGKFENMPPGFGPMFRSATVFEDIVKTICTTNIQWSGTRRMVGEIIDAYGTPFTAKSVLKCFPSATDIASDSFENFKKSAKLGYRASYIYELAVQVACAKINLETFLEAHWPAQTLKNMLLEIKGIGPYGAATMLSLLGHYDELPIDTVFRDFISRKYHNGTKKSDKKAAQIYKKWGKWKTLAYWYDLRSDQ